MIIGIDVFVLKKTVFLWIEMYENALPLVFYLTIESFRMLMKAKFVAIRFVLKKKKNCSIEDFYWRKKNERILVNSWISFVVKSWFELNNNKTRAWYKETWNSLAVWKRDIRWCWQEKNKFTFSFNQPLSKQWSSVYCQCSFLPLYLLK